MATDELHYGHDVMEDDKQLNVRLVSVKRIKTEDEKGEGGIREYDNIAIGAAEILPSVKIWGVIEPIIVRPIYDDPEYDYEVQEGRCRILASIMAGKTEIPARIETKYGDSKAVEITCNKARKDFTESEDKKAFLHLKELESQQKKLNIKQTAKERKKQREEHYLSSDEFRKRNYLYRKFAEQPELYGDLQKKFDDGTYKLNKTFEKAQTIEQDEKGDLKLPEGKFNIFVCRAMIRNNRSERFSINGNLTPTELKRLPIDDHSANDAIMCLWGTGSRLMTLGDILINGWKFKYVNVIPVHGGRHQGKFVLPDHEFILIGMKGRMKDPLKAFGGIDEPDPKLSDVDRVKAIAENLRSRIEEIYPDTKRMSMMINIPGFENMSIKYKGKK